MKARSTVNARQSKHAVANWSDLRTGDRIEVIKDARAIMAGRAEEVSASGNLLWVASEGTGRGQSFAKSDGVSVRRQQDSSDATCAQEARRVPDAI